MGGSNLGRFKPLLIDAASSATRDERIDVSIWAEDVEAASFAATAAAVAFLLSSSVNEVCGWEGGGRDTLGAGIPGGKVGSSFS